MAGFKEEIAKIEELAKEDAQFRNEYLAAVKSQELQSTPPVVMDAVV